MVTLSRTCPEFIFFYLSLIDWVLFKKPSSVNVACVTRVCVCHGHPSSPVFLFSCSANAAGSQDDLANDTEPEVGPSLRRDRDRERDRERERERPRRKDAHDHGEFTHMSVLAALWRWGNTAGLFAECCLLQEDGWTVTLGRSAGRRLLDMTPPPRWWAVSWTPPASSTQRRKTLLAGETYFSRPRHGKQGFFLLFWIEVWCRCSVCRLSQCKTPSPHSVYKIFINRVIKLGH